MRALPPDRGWAHRSPRPDGSAAVDERNALHQRFIARQPIFDQQANVFAYELLFRAGPQNTFQPSPEASSGVIVASTTTFDLDALVGPTKVFMNVDEAALQCGAARLLPPSRVVVEILETVEPNLQVVEACADLCRDGYVLALDDFVDDPKWEPLVELAKFLKVDFRALDVRARDSVARRYLPRGFHLLAEKVETQADVSNARDLGYTFFQGYFFCKPQMVAAREIPANKMICMLLLKAVAAPTLSYPEIESLFKRDPALVYRLLRYLNSPLLGLRTEVHNVRQALNLLGERECRRWISIVALLSMAGDKPPELVRTAILRGYFCEEVSMVMDTALTHPDFFLLGLLSVVDALLDQPMGEVLAHLAVSEEVRVALCGGSNRLRDVYEVLLDYERGDWKALSSAAARVGDIEECLPVCYLKAAECARQVAG